MTFLKDKDMMHQQITRRETLKTIGAAAVLSALPGASSAREWREHTQRRRVLRIAHLTDIHVEPEKKAAAGFAACLHHLQNLADRADLLLTGGDSVYDSFEADDARTQLQWDLWKSVLKN